MLKNLFYIKLNSQSKKEIRSSFYYCLKFNFVILLLGIILTCCIDKSSNPDWLVTVKNQGISYFFPSLLLPSKLLVITLSLLPLIIFFLAVLYLTIALYCNSRQLNIIKLLYLRYSLSFSLLYFSRKIMLLFIGFS